MWGKKSWIHWREGNFGVTYPHQKTRWNDLGTFCLGQFWQKLGKEENDFWIKLKFVVVSQLLAKEPSRFSMLLPAIYLGARVIHRYSNFLGGVRSEVKGSRSEWVADLWEQLRFLKYLPSSNLTVKAHGKEGVGRQNIPFWEGLFSGAFFVSFRECNLDMFFGDWFFRIWPRKELHWNRPGRVFFLNMFILLLLWEKTVLFSERRLFGKKCHLGFFQREDYLGRNVIWVFFPDILEWWFHRIFWNDSRWNEWVRCDIYKPSVIRSACII